MRIWFYATWNYLRARGEYQIEDPWDTYLGELPPRTRRILSNGVHCESGAGTTSAHAENTKSTIPTGRNRRNYLRARGEYALLRYAEAGCEELPPRTRRILCRGAGTKAKNGTTSAHAENTTCVRVAVSPSTNYLRARGEYYADEDHGQPEWELPPRTRRIRCALGSQIRDSGTTSAHAENTAPKIAHHLLFRNYLRARGEYYSSYGDSGSSSELPPRTRRIPRRWLLMPNEFGTTSAHAENTYCPG